MSVRRAIVEADVSTLNVSEFCRLHDVSTWFFYQLRRRYALGGEAALEPLSRAPKRVANKTLLDVAERVVALRKELGDDGLDNGPATIRFHLQRRHATSPSEATIWRLLRDRGFIVPEPRKRPAHTPQRFSAERANECWQIDATKWSLTETPMIEIIDVVDDCSRTLIASVAVPTCTTANAWSTLCCGADEWGWPERVLSDNGTPFRGQGQGGMLPALAALGIRDGHSRPYHPQTCGKVERFHQTLKLHLSHQQPATTLAELQTQLDRFRDIYNHHRPHRAIGRRFPADVWATTPRSGPAKHPLGTPTKTSTTRVGSDGRISIANRTRITVGTPYKHQTAITVITGSHAHVFIDGRLIRQLTLNPNTRNHPKERE
ncbi:MAG TPA: IS481 family transposase [Ilumatobacteraceae bacterium]|nr:IS481 family transposase [Ilumatobacteraceae bacterium]